MAQEDEVSGTPEASQNGSPSPQKGDDGSDELISLAFGELLPEEEYRRRQLLDAAVACAQRKWRVIPLCWVDDDVEEGCGYTPHNRRGPCPAPGKHPILNDWPNRATNDPVKAQQWWRPVKPNSIVTEEWYPHANIGVVLGEGSGIFGLDVDTDRDGDKKLESLEREHGKLPLTRVHGTGSGGAHHLFEWPGFRVHNIKPWGVDAGLDIKGDNGYIVVPPSISHKGPYTLSPAMEDAPIAKAPEWILEKLRRERTEQLGLNLNSSDALPNRLIDKYVAAAKKNEHWKLSGTKKGDRNSALNNAALALGSLGVHGFLSMDEAMALLLDASHKNGMIADDNGTAPFHATFRSGWNAGLRRPRDLSGVGNLSDNEWRRYSWDEFGLGARLVEYFGERLRWVDNWQAWMSYSSGIWKRQTASEAERLAQAMIELLDKFEVPRYDDQAELDGEPSPQAQFKAWLRKQRSNARKVATAKCARDFTVIRAEPDVFDEKPDLLNCANGVVDLLTGELKPHDPDLMLTMRCTQPYEPKAQCPGWLAFLERVQPEEEMRSYLHRVAGYSITGDIGEQVFFLHTGTGANGKSVFHDVIARVIGAYSQTVPVETLMDSSMDRIPNDVARMAGRRYLQASETKSGKFLDEPKLKSLTGGDAVAARFMRGDYFEFRPVGKIHLTTNHLPRLSDDSATWRRIHLIRWPVFIPEREREGGLVDRLVREEGAGILAWLVQGALQWREQKLNPPDAALMAKEDYKRSEDEHQQWLEDECVIDMERTTLSSASESKVLWAHNRQWRQENGYMPIGQRAFTEMVKKKGYHYHNAGGFRGFPQISIRVPGGVRPS